MKRRTFLSGTAAVMVLSMLPMQARATDITAEDALQSVIARFPILSGLRIVYADHPGLSLWPGKINGTRDYRVVEMWQGYSYTLYPDALLHECGHALDYWAGIARNDPARFIDSPYGEIPYDGVLADFWKVRGFDASPFTSYVEEEISRRRLQASGVQQFVGDDYYYQFTPSEQFANCFAAVMRGLRDEAQLGIFRTTNWNIPMDATALSAFFADAAHPSMPLPPTTEFSAEDYRAMSSDGSMTVWYSRSRGRNVFFMNGSEITY